jgi:hypothetical protein
MVQKVLQSNPFAYWTTLLELLSRPRVLEHYLDVPLAQAIPRSRWMTAWSTTILGLAFLLHFHLALTHWLLGHSATPSRVASACIYVVTLALTAVIGYGFFRLYTLVCHVLTINVFKTRGQRLRLLNAEATLMTLSAPAAAAYIVALIQPTLGWALFWATFVYFVVLFAHAFNIIFHKQRLGGLWLLLGSTAVTWFVLAIGALAIAVTLAVIAFFIIAVLRLFVRHS